MLELQQGDYSQNYDARTMRQRVLRASTRPDFNNSEIETLISKRLSVENKAKLTQLTRADFVTIAKLTH